MADAAVMSGGASFVHLRKNGGALDGEDAIVKMFRQRVANVLLDTGQFHRRQEFAVGKLWQAFRLPADAGELFDVVVPGCNVRIANGPSDGDAFRKIRCKIEIAPAVTLTSPSNGFPTNLPPANPAEFRARRIGIGIFFVADKEFVRELVAGVMNFALNWLGLLPLWTFIPAAEFEFPSGNVLDVI